MPITKRNSKYNAEVLRKIIVCMRYAIFFIFTPISNDYKTFFFGAVNIFTLRLLLII